MPKLEQRVGGKKPRRLKLRDWHASHGAEFRESRGYEVPWRYSPAPSSETEIAATGPVRSGLLDLSDHARLELVGADRQRFLGGLVTCAVADLEPGSGEYGFITTIKGKVLADVVVSVFEDRLFLLLPPGRADIVREHLEKYIVADRVEVLPLEDLLPVAIVGSELADRLPRSGFPADPWGCGMMELFGTEFPVTRHERLGAPALVAWISSSIVEPVVREWLERLDLELIGREIMDRLRVQAGLPAFGIDYGEDNLAQESGIEAIDFTKGCYLGQEVIARLHYRGQAPKLVRRLVFDELVGNDDAGWRKTLPMELSFEGRPAGQLTTVSGAIGLGMVQRRASEPGTVVEVAGAQARVESLN